MLKSGQLWGRESLQQRCETIPYHGPLSLVAHDGVQENNRKYGVEDEASERGLFINRTGILEGGIQTVLEKADTAFYAEPLLYSQ